MIEKTKRVTIILTIIYAALVVWIILFKMSALSEIASLDHFRSINLIPFHYDIEQAFHRNEVLNNVAIFIPIGLYLKMLKIKNAKAILYGCVFSLILEILQFVLAVGAADITDIITNTCGTVIGVFIYCVLVLVFRKAEKLNKVLNIFALICTILLIALMAMLFFTN